MLCSIFKFKDIGISNFQYAVNAPTPYHMYASNLNSIFMFDMNPDTN